MAGDTIKETLMKRLLILLLLLPSLAWSAEPIEVARMNPYILGGGVAAAASTFCSSATATTGGINGLICEDFNGSASCADTYTSNCRNTWTVVAGTPNFEYATSPAPLEGTKSLLLDALTDEADTWIYKPFTWTTGQTHWLYIVINNRNLPTGSGAAMFAKITENNGAGCAYFGYSKDGLGTYLYVGAGGGTPANTVGTISSGHTYHVWMSYTVGTGANSTATIAFSENGTKPTSGDNYAECTNGTWTDTPTRLYLMGKWDTNSTYSSEPIIDKVILDDASIGNSPS
jgi:hypothetical protein